MFQDFAEAAFSIQFLSEEALEVFSLSPAFTVAGCANFILVIFEKHIE